MEEIYTAKGKSSPVLQNTAEDLYTAVMRKPNDSSTESGDIEAAPPIPSHTIEELYTAVMKKSAEDREEAPPIPLYTVEENTF